MLTVTTWSKIDAVMTAASIWSMLARRGGPTEKLTLEQDLIDWAGIRRFQLRSSFAYTVVSLDESRAWLVYVDRSSNPNYDASVCLWKRQDELANGLDGCSLPLSSMDCPKLAL